MPNRKLNDAYTLRLPEGWRAAIKAMAAENERSMNAEIIFHLRKVIPVDTNEKDRQGCRPDGLDEIRPVKKDSCP